MERACRATNSHLVDDLVNIIVNTEGYSVLIIPGRNNDPNEHVQEQIKTDFRQLHPENKFTTGQLGAKKAMISIHPCIKKNGMFQ